MTTFRIDPAALRAIRHRLHDLGVESAAVLGEAGASTGQAVVGLWALRLADRGGPTDPGLLDQRRFGAMLAELFDELGWGRVLVDQPGDDVVVLTTANGPESEPGSADEPACHFMVGALAALFSTLADAQLAVLEVECRSVTDPACRFLVASPETIAAARDMTLAGGSWHEILETPTHQ